MRSVSVKVKCGARWHTIGFDGRALTFPSHKKDLTALYRTVTLSEFGHRRCGCANVLAAWRAGTLEDIPEPLRQIRQEISADCGAYRLTRRLAVRLLTRREKVINGLVDQLLDCEPAARFEKLTIALSRVLMYLGITHEVERGAQQTVRIHNLGGAKRFSTNHNIFAFSAAEQLEVTQDTTAEDERPEFRAKLPFEGSFAGAPERKKVAEHVAGLIESIGFRAKVACVQRDLRVHEHERLSRALSYRDAIGPRALVLLEREGVLTFDEEIMKPVYFPEKSDKVRVVGVGAIKALAAKAAEFDTEVQRLASLADRYAAMAKKSVAS